MVLTKAIVVIWASAVMVLGVGTAQHLNGAGGTSSARTAAVQQWFNKMDVSRDGQLQESELRQFIGAQLGPTDFNTGRKLDHATEQVTEKLDGEDVGITISMKELGQYLPKVLEGVKVSDWVSHSLELPMYAEAFRDNAVTVLDFPLLVNDGGKLLETELMVTRVLHRQKILRAMQRQMLGLGVEPGTIPVLQCTSSKESASAALGDSGVSSIAAGGSSSGSSNSNLYAGAAALQPGLVRCVWVQPDTPGEPTVHKYVLDRFAMHRPGATWQPVAELDDTAMTQFNDVVDLPGTYQYRVAAWNLYGRSAYTFSDDVLLVSPSRPAQAAADSALLGTDALAQHSQQQADQQQKAPLQHNVTDRGDHGVEQLKSIESKLLQFSDRKSDVVPTGSSGHATHKLTSNSMALAHQHHHQHQQQPVHIGEAALADQPQQQHEGLSVAVAVMHATAGVLQPQGSSSSSLPNDLVRDTADSGRSSCCAQQAPPHALGPAAHPSSCSCSSDTMWCPSHGPTDDDAGDHNNNGLVISTSSTAAAIAAQSPATAAPNVVWVVSQAALTDGSPSTPAAIAAQVQLLQSMQAAAGVAVAEAAAGQSSQANIGLNSMGRSAGSAGNKAAGNWSVAAFFAAWVGKWLKALVNSLLLLVLPACVRLLPVPVLHKLASTLARALYFLPRPLQRVVHKYGTAAGVEQQQQQERVTADAQPGGSGSPVRIGAVGEREVGALPNSKEGPRSLNSTPTSAVISSSSDVYTEAPSTGMNIPLGAASVADVTAVDVAAGERGRGVNSPSSEELQRCGSNTASPMVRLKSAGMTKSSSEVGLMWHWPNSPVSSSTGRQLEPAAAASPAQAAAAGPYAGMYGFAWQTGPMTGAAAAAAAGGAVNVASEIQAVYAAMAPDVADNKLQQQQREQQWRASMQAAPVHGSDNNSSRGGHAFVNEELLLVSKLPNRKRCAFPGCTQQFHLRHLRAMLQRHYCGRCQQAFCLAHTAYSPHGPGGGCGAESRCVCCSCIFDFTSDYRSFLMSRNTLPSEGGRRTRSGPPAGRGSSDNGGSYSPASKHGSAARQRAAATSKSSPMLQQRQQQHVQAAGWLRMGVSRSSDGLLQPGVACSSAGVSSEAVIATAQAVPAGEAVTAAQQAAPAGSKHMKSRMLWSRAWTKATAVVRLSHAGQQHQEQAVC